VIDIGMTQIAQSRPAAIILSAATGYGGGERSLEVLLPLLARDYQLHLLIENRRHMSHCQDLLSDTDARMTRLPGFYRPLQILYSVIWLLQKWRLKPDFILTNTNKSALIVAVVSRIFPSVGKSTKVYVRDFQWRGLGFIAKSLKAALFLVPSPALVESNNYLASYVCPKGLVHWAVVPNAALTARVDKPAAIPRQLVGERYILSLATITRWKGQEYAIEALKMLPPDVHLVCSGDVADQSYLDQLKSITSALKLEDRVHFLEFQNDPSGLLQNAVCVAITSVSLHGGPETFGRVVIEAWMQSTPVVAFDCGGPKHLIASGVTGILTTESDAADLAAAIQWIIDNPDHAGEIAQRGAREVREHHGQEKIYGLLTGLISNKEAAPQSPASNTSSR
jgi:glycosyltransferase involved in cell wall biosynthesis